MRDEDLNKMQHDASNFLSVDVPSIKLARHIDALVAEVRLLRAALQPFAEWHAKIGEENIDRLGVAAFRQAAQLLSSSSAR